MRWSWIGLLGDIKNKTWRKIWPIIASVAVIGAIVLAIFQMTEYATFTSDIDEIDFTFKYPQHSRDKPTIIQSDDKYTVDIKGPFVMSVSVYLESSSQPQADARTVLNEYIETYSTQPNFKLHTNSILTDGAFSGPRAVIHYDAVDESMNDNRYVPSQTFLWVFPYNGKLYEISITGDREVLNEKWEEQARFFVSFKILD